MSRRRKDPTQYARVAFNCLNANKDLWNMMDSTSKDAERAISRIFYELVFSSGANRSGYSTVLKNNWDFQKMCDDHYMAPQSVTKFIMDEGILLDDWDGFLECFMMCRKTHYVTKQQNDQLARLTKNTAVLTRDRYKHMGFNLYKEGKPNYIMKRPELQVPSYFTDWEQGYQSNGFRATVVENEVGNLKDFFG